ncbi:hypothetical protein ACJX0J_018764, partial [Zea mays]
MGNIVIYTPLLEYVNEMIWQAGSKDVKTINIIMIVQLYIFIKPITGGMLQTPYMLRLFMIVLIHRTYCLLRDQKDAINSVPRKQRVHDVHRSESILEHLWVALLRNWLFALEGTDEVIVLYNIHDCHN